MPKRDCLVKLHLFGANVILHDGKVATFERSNKVVEAVAVKNRKILALGNSDLMLELTGERPIYGS